LPDPIYSSTLVTKFINSMMWEGKKAVAEEIFYGAMEKIGERTGDEPLKVFKRAVESVAPALEVKSRRIGGATYQVPLEVSKDRRNTLAIRWIVSNARNRSEKTMRDRLVGELLDSMSGRGGAMKKKEDVHRMAEANKAFAHYRF
jgi:small subunit ribosomal protein S7